MNFGDRVKAEKLISLTELISDSEISVSFVEYLKESAKELEILSQTDGTYAVKQSSLPEITQKYAVWWGENLKRRWCDRKPVNLPEFRIPEYFKPESKISETLSKALRLTGDRDGYLAEIVRRTPSGVSVISQLCRYYEEPVKARKQLFICADEIYTREQGIK